MHCPICNSSTMSLYKKTAVVSINAKIVPEFLLIKIVMPKIRLFNTNKTPPQKPITIP